MLQSRVRSSRHWGENMEPRFDGIASEKSHRNMSRIKGKDTSIEIMLRRALRKKGYGYRKNYKGLPGTPDVVLTKYRIAIFCDSEFFHGKNWQQLKNKVEKGKNSDYWVRKIERNIERDMEKDKMLVARGWTVIHFWGDEIKTNIDECIKTIEESVFETQMTNLLDYDLYEKNDVE